MNNLRRRGRWSRGVVKVEGRERWELLVFRGRRKGLSGDIGESHGERRRKPGRGNERGCAEARRAETSRRDKRES